VAIYYDVRVLETSQAQISSTSITEGEVKAAVRNRRGKEVMALLLDRRGDQIGITEEVVKAAAGNEERGEEVMTLLIERLSEVVAHINESAGLTTATCGQLRVLDLLCGRSHFFPLREK